MDAIFVVRHENCNSTVFLAILHKISNRGTCTFKPFGANRRTLRFKVSEIEEIGDTLSCMDVYHTMSDEERLAFSYEGYVELKANEDWNN